MISSVEDTLFWWTKDNVLVNPIDICDGTIYTSAHNLSMRLNKFGMGFYFEPFVAYVGEIDVYMIL